MNEQDYLDVLAKRLNSYLTNEDKKYDSTLMINSIISSIIQYFECDYQKLIDAIETLNHMKNIGTFTRYSDVENVFDVSSQTELSVKGFLSKGKPILFFYKENDENPYGIIKTETKNGKDIYSIEISNNPDTLAYYKRDFVASGDTYVFAETYEYDSESLKTKRSVFAETGEDMGKLDVFSMTDSEKEYRNLLLLIRNALSENLDFNEISGFGMDILFLSFYDSIKSLCKKESIFSLEDMLYLANETIYPENKNLVKPYSQLVNNIEKQKLIELEIGEQKKFSFVLNIDGKDIEYRIVRSEKYLSVDAFENDKKLSGYMIVSSVDGFSFFRLNGNYVDEKSENYIPSFVIHFVGNQIKFMSIEDKENKSLPTKTFDTLITFGDDGKIKLESQDINISKVLKNQNLSVQVGPLNN